MVASIIKRADRAVELRLDQVLRPARLRNGTEPEQRINFFGISWSSYLAFDRELGRDRSSPRLYYLDGDLEIMSTSEEHERIKKWLGDFLGDFFFESDMDVVTRGQTTIRRALKKAGAEPDESWCLGGAKKFPDLVLEVALTSGVDKLEIYRRLQIPEVWFWRANRIEVFVLGKAGQYERSDRSVLLPQIDLRLLERCVAMNSWREARKTFRASLSKRG